VIATDSPVVLAGRGLVKRYGHITALDGMDFELRDREILAVIGDNGAGKSSLIRALSGALVPDAGEIFLRGRPVHFRTPIDARRAGIETVYQTLAVAPNLTVAENFFLGREVRRDGIPGRVLRMLDRGRMIEESSARLRELGIEVQSMTQTVASLSGGQRQGVAVARSAAFGRYVVIMDEPTAALGVKESGMVLELIRRVRDRGLAVVLVSHNMPQVFDLADRIHVARLGQRVAVLDPRGIRMNDAVAVMTGALPAAELPAGALA
jgi:fructose transport system ATP-binding protein